jgi:hypothetical protein
LEKTKMALSLHDVQLNPAHRVAGERDLTWSRLRFRFKDDETDHHPSIEMLLLAKAAQGVTIGELEKQAMDSAKTILRATLDLLEANDITRLLDSQAERQKEERDHPAWEQMIPGNTGG